MTKAISLDKYVVLRTFELKFPSGSFLTWSKRADNHILTLQVSISDTVNTVLTTCPVNFLKIYYYIKIYILSTLSASHLTKMHFRREQPPVRVVYIRQPSVEWNTSKAKFLHFVKPVYGFFKSGDQFHKTSNDQYRNGFKIRTMDLNPSFCAWEPPVRYVASLVGTLKTLYVQKTIYFKSYPTNALKWVLEIPYPVSLTGFHLSRDETETVILDQTFYINKIKPMATYASFSNFRWSRMHFARISH